MGEEVPAFIVRLHSAGSANGTSIDGYVTMEQSVLGFMQGLPRIAVEQNAQIDLPAIRTGDVRIVARRSAEVL
jgi:hypothetical protein